MGRLRTDPLVTHPSATHSVQATQPPEKSQLWSQLGPLQTQDTPVQVQALGSSPLEDV